MTPERHKQIKILFLELAELEKDEQARRLDVVQETDTELAREVRSLLSHNVEKTLITRPLPGIEARPEQHYTRPTGQIAARLLGTGIRRLGTALLIAGVLAGVGLWAHRSIEAALLQIRAQELKTILDANVLALDIWISERKRDARTFASFELVESLVRDMTHEDETRAESARAQFRRIARGYFQNAGTGGVLILDQTGLVIADTELPSVVGLRLKDPTGFAYLARALDGEVLFIPPYRDESLATQSATTAPRRVRQRIWFMAPVTDEKATIKTALVFSKFADLEFSDILGVAKIGETGEAYAFDRDGHMLSDSRFGRELEATGAVPKGAGGQTMLHLEVRDPGGDLIAGHIPQSAKRARPLTELAARALNADEGSVTTPYRNYRGASVIGNFAWLPHHELAVAAEVESKEAFRPLIYLEAAFGVLFGLLTLTVLFSFASSLAVVRLRREVGRRLGQYTLSQKLGEGGMGEVYLAQHALLKRPTAIKLLKASVTSDETKRRFEKEVQLASQLTHPNTIAIYDYGQTEDGIFYYAMEYLKGLNLVEAVALSGPLPAARVAHILRQICGSLHEAHERGLVHRDIKPGNVMLCEQGGEFDVVKVLDFGLVKDLSKQDLSSMAEVRGTPRYMAPERFKNPAAVDGRVDLFATGAVIYFLLTGKHAFDAGTDVSVLAQVIGVVPPAPRSIEASIPEAFDTLVMRMIEKDIDERPRDATEIVEALDAMNLPRWSQRDAEAWWRAEAARAL